MASFNMARKPTVKMRKNSKSEVGKLNRGIRAEYAEGTDGTERATDIGRVEQRRDMIRPMTSDVSALSGIVANGHQAVHFVSSAPSKIPYGGFSPVRLQTGCRDAIFGGALAPSYRRPQPSSHIRPLLLSGCLDSSSHPNVPNAESDTPVQWPLAPPAVILSAGLIAYYGHIRASVHRGWFLRYASRVWASRSSPIYSAKV
jgi:hypothetical protein